MNQRIDLVAGQNCSLPATHLHVLMTTGKSIPGLDVDISAFLLNTQGKVSSDHDFIFFNQLADSHQGIVLDPEHGRFTLHLERIRSDVQKIALTMTIADGLARQQDFTLVHQATVLIKDFLTGWEIAYFPMITRENKETALILGEFYRHQDKWKFRAVGQGFLGGLQPLAEHFGVDISEGESAAPTRTGANPPEKVNLGKITLEKKGQSVSLEKPVGGIGEILINLNWNSLPVKPAGVFGKTKPGIDLDLACLWEFHNGSIGAVQALGGHFGNFHQFPYIELDQDDRSGQSVAGETLRINGNHWHEFRRILIFTFIYEGVPNWSHVDAVITIKSKNQPEIEVRLDSHRNDQFMCAIAMLENIDNQLKITKLIDYFSGHEQLDRAFGWGLNYVAGSK